MCRKETTGKEQGHLIKEHQGHILKPLPILGGQL